MSQLAKTFAYDFAALTDRGRVRPQNEDSVAAFPEFGALSQALCAAWPPLVAGTHRLRFDDGRVRFGWCRGGDENGFMACP